MDENDPESGLRWDARISLTVAGARLWHDATEWGAGCSSWMIRKAEGFDAPEDVCIVGRAKRVQCFEWMPDLAKNLRQFGKTGGSRGGEGMRDHGKRGELLNRVLPCCFP